MAVHNEGKKRRKRYGKKKNIVCRCTTYQGPGDNLDIPAHTKPPPPGKCGCTRAQSMILNAHESLRDI